MTTTKISFNLTRFYNCLTHKTKQTKNLSSPSKRIFAFGSEKVYVIFELQLEYKIFLDGVFFVGSGDTVAEQWQTGQWRVVLERFVEEQAEIGEHHPQLLPAVTVFELPQQETA